MPETEPDHNRPHRTSVKRRAIEAKRSDGLRQTGISGAARLTKGGGGVLDAESHPALEPEFAEMAHERPGSLDRVVFGVTAALSIGFVLWGVLDTGSLSAASGHGLTWVVDKAGWLFALSSTGFVFFVIWLAAGKYAQIPLGRDNETPEFSTVSWVAMMFSAGMGIGLMFYGAYEPLSHLLAPPPGTEGSGQAAETAMATTMFHWSLHPWSMYAVVGLAIAYGVFRRGRPLTISAVFEPLIGKRQAYGPGGKVIDIFAIFATLFGSATSLGLGALQIASGMEIVGWVGKTGNALLTGIIVVLTICFIISAVSGIEKGIQWLSNTNMVLALLLATFVFVLGPTVFILNMLPTTLGTYFQDWMSMAARTGAEGADTSAWLAKWSIFYWAWWASWTPFVGMFIARISRGRTVRQFVTGVLLVPSVVSLVWFAIFGGAAVHIEQLEHQLSKADSAEGTLFSLLQTMPLATVTSILVMVLVGIFFVSGADAASIVMGTLSENGTLEPRRFTVVFWGVATGAAAVVMLLIGGSDALTGLQNITIIAALPFLVVMLGMAVSLVKDLASDPLVVRRQYARAAVEQAVVQGVTEHGDDFALGVNQTHPGDGVGRYLADSAEQPQPDSPDQAAD